MHSGLRARVHNREQLLGIFCFTPSPLLVEFIAVSNYDFVIIDLEHSLTDLQTLDHMIVAARSQGLAVLVRVPLECAHLVLPILDAGASGIVFPRIQSVAQAKRAVQLCRYAPEGDRGLSVHRHLNFKSDELAQRNKAINDSICVVLMIEDTEGVANARELACVEGVDVILEGAADLSASLGVPWQTQHPTVKEELKKIAAGVASSSAKFCAIPRATEDYQRWMEQGISMFVLGTDRGIIRQALQANLDKFVRFNVKQNSVV
jgi:staphyloferrin B biosynthesis citrate synthase